MNNNDVALRKRSQIAKANRTMFLWIALASALVGAAAVVGIFLGQQLIYNEKVLAQKVKTADTLKQNLAVIDDLKKEILVLDTNQDLALVKANPNDQALQVILDALPSEPNSLALGASLQGKLLAGIDGLQPIDTLQIDSVVSEEALAEETEVDASLAGGEEDGIPQNSIGFTFAISGTEAALKQLLQKLERSIRTIEVTNLRIETKEDGQFLMNVSARAYYEPTRTLELRQEVVPR